MSAHREDRCPTVVKRTGTLLLTLGLYGFPAVHCGAMVYHSNGSAASVQALQNAAHNGDTITIPAGTFTWGSGVRINKGITLQGVAGATRINRAAGTTHDLITIQPTADVPVRVTGIRFNQPVGQNGDKHALFVQGPYGGTWGLTQLRIDHCYFYGGVRTIFLRYRINGVVDHNTFHNCAYITEHFGDDNHAWNRAGTPQFGTSDAIFFEDNSIILDNALSYTDVQSDINTGGKIVWRYNTFDTTQYTGIFGSIIGAHGNGLYWQGSNDWNRGGIMTEFYGNTVRFSNAFRIIWLRGGRNIVANNTFVGNLGSGKLVAFDEEEGFVFTPRRTTWPAEDQVNNTFIFGNTLNGQPTTAAMVGCWQAGSQPFIHRARDYWLRPPSPTTITNYPRPGYPSLPNHPLPYNPPITSWSPYVYPHPLVSGEPSSTDFNNDGNPDYVLYNVTTRQTVVWYMDGNIHVSTSYGPTFPAGWSLVGVADFNGDDHPDYLLFKPATRQTVIWYLNNNVHVSSAFGPTTWAGWNVAGVADFNLDGHPDYLLFNPITKQTAIWYLNNNLPISSAFGPTIWPAWNVAGVADFNVDGDPDYLLFNPITKQTAIWYLNNNVRVSSAFGPTIWPLWSLLGL
jgi:FG-GAP-like repeat